MPEPRYQQYCPLARALDTIGDRWTLLIVRELVPGPRRFTDLIEGLPGISRNLLTERLRGLERDGILARQELPPPAARQVYELTEDGRRLGTAMGPLIGWGARRLGERKAGESFRARWAAVGMTALADREAAEGVSETYQFLIGDSAFHFAIEDGSIQVHDGLAQNPAGTVTTDEKTWQDIASGKISATSATVKGALEVTGDRQAVERLGKIFSRDPLLAQAGADIPGARRE